MKVRQGFVSNSSSSSFLFIGKEMKFEDICLNDIKQILVVGMFLETGQDVFPLTKQLFMELYKGANIYDISRCRFYYCYISGEYRIEISSDKYTKGGKTFALSVERDMDYTETLEQLKDRYPRGEIRNNAI